MLVAEGETGSEEARAMADRQLHQNPSDPTALLLRALSLMVCAQWSAALTAFSILFEQHPEFDERAYFWAAQCRVELSDATGAVRCLSKYLALCPQSVSALLWRGQLYGKLSAG